MLVAGGGASNMSELTRIQEEIRTLQVVVSSGQTGAGPSAAGVIPPSGVSTEEELAAEKRVLQQLEASGGSANIVLIQQKQARIKELTARTRGGQSAGPPPDVASSPGKKKSFGMGKLASIGKIGKKANSGQPSGQPAPGSRTAQDLGGTSTDQSGLE